jgi:glycosyltransferase involved in cell wall biosynthesis
MIRLGIANQETWGFFNEIFESLRKEYDVDVFARREWKLPVFHSRINQALFRYDLQKYLSNHDVVFFEWASDLLAAASQMPKACGVVARLHRYEMYQWVDKIRWQNVDKIILVSHAKKQEFIRKFPDQVDKIVVNGPSTSLEKFTPVSKSFNGDIGILCHLTPRKRVYDLILTFSELLQLDNRLHLHIAGGPDPAFGDYYFALQQIVTDLDLSDKVTFYGNVTETWDWYHKIDIFISNSYSEGLQVAPMEAMASGCYCLSHRWFGANELMPSENLYYTNEELKDKVLRYCELPDEEKNEQRKLMRKHAQENFDINQTIRKIHQVIDEVAESKTWANN